MTAMSETHQRRFLGNITVGDGCWEWQGARTGVGYGALNVGGKAKSAHRLAYEWFVGPIPEGLLIDHLCRVRHCVRPDHLEAVTFDENVRRGLAGVLRTPATHCKRGHEFTPENTLINRRGFRSCKTCAKRNNNRAQRARRAAARLAATS